MATPKLDPSTYALNMPPVDTHWATAPGSPGDGPWVIPGLQNPWVYQDFSNFGTNSYTGNTPYDQWLRSFNRRMQEVVLPDYNTPYSEYMPKDPINRPPDGDIYDPPEDGGGEGGGGGGGGGGDDGGFVIGPGSNDVVVGPGSGPKTAEQLAYEKNRTALQNLVRANDQSGVFKYLNDNNLNASFFEDALDYANSPTSDARRSAKNWLRQAGQATGGTVDGLTYASPEDVKFYIDWALGQDIGSPVGVTMGSTKDLWAKQGITDPYSDQKILDMAQDRLERENFIYSGKSNDKSGFSGIYKTYRDGQGAAPAQAPAPAAAQAPLTAIQAAATPAVSPSPAAAPAPAYQQVAGQFTNQDTGDIVTYDSNGKHTSTGKLDPSWDRTSSAKLDPKWGNFFSDNSNNGMADGGLVKLHQKYGEGGAVDRPRTFSPEMSNRIAKLFVQQTMPGALSTNQLNETFGPSPSIGEPTSSSVGLVRDPVSTVAPQNRARQELMNKYGVSDRPRIFHPAQQNALTRLYMQQVMPGALSEDQLDEMFGAMPTLGEVEPRGYAGGGEVQGFGGYGTDPSVMQDPSYIGGGQTLSPELRQAILQDAQANGISNPTTAFTGAGPRGSYGYQQTRAAPQETLQQMSDAYDSPEMMQYAQEYQETRKRAAEDRAKFEQLLQASLNRNDESGPSKAEMYFKLAAAFGAPTKTGNFGESLANATEVMAGHQKELRQASMSARDRKDKLALEVAKYRADGSKEDLSSLRTLTVEEMKARRLANIPMSEIGKALMDAGLRPGTPEFAKAMNEAMALKQQTQEPAPHFMTSGDGTQLAVNRSGVATPVKDAAGNVVVDPNYEDVNTPITPVLGVPVPSVVPWKNQSNPKDANKVKAAEQTRGAKEVENDYDAAKKLLGTAQEATRFKALNAETPTGEVLDKIPLGQWVQSFGANYNDMQAINARLTPGMREPGSGNSSDFDVKMFKMGTVSVDKPKEVNDNIATGYELKAKQAEDYADFRATYLAQNGTLQGANTHWKAYVEKNPIFDPSSPKTPKINPNRLDWKSYFSKSDTVDAPAPAASGSSLATAAAAELARRKGGK